MSELVPGWIGPAWARSGPVRALTTTRIGGLSGGVRATFDLGHGSDRVSAASASNRRRLRRALSLPTEPCWLRQQHGVAAVEATAGAGAGAPVADGAWTATSGPVCVVLTADCLPVVLADRGGQAVGVAHAGWRGLAAGVVEAVAAAMPVVPADLRAWLGPAIGPRAFEVGPEVRDAFVERDPAAGIAFRRGRGDRWFADLYGLARQRLQGIGIADVTGGGHCTVAEPQRFFSYRRDGAGTGRMATLAWLVPPS